MIVKQDRHVVTRMLGVACLFRLIPNQPEDIRQLREILVREQCFQIALGEGWIGIALSQPDRHGSATAKSHSEGVTAGFGGT